MREASNGLATASVKPPDSLAYEFFVFFILGAEVNT